MINPTRTLLAGLALVGLLGLSACGDTTEDAADDSSSQPTTPGGEGTAGKTVDCADAPGETVTVDIGDFVFEPATVKVSACDQVVWSNTHNQAHTSTGNGDTSWSTGNIAPGAEAEPVSFETPGTFAYICALHPFMKGTVEVS